MFITAVILVLLAALSFGVAGLIAVRKRNAGAWPAAMWVGIIAHSAALACALVEGQHREFTYAVVGSWAGIASMFFLLRFLHLRSRDVLLLPAAGVVLLVVLATGAGHLTDVRHGSDDTRNWVTWLHIGFMSLHFAAMIVAVSASGIWYSTRRKLKRVGPGVLELPSLPRIERLIEWGLIVAAALMIGGLSTGGVAISSSPDFQLTHPTPILGILEMVILVALLAANLTGHMRPRVFARGAIVVFILSATSLVSVVVSSPHGG